jgi:uncharacterized protein YdhG (YjbR/CyaY superfamily)
MMAAQTWDPFAVDDYIDSFPPETQSALHDLRGAIRRAAPRAVERISYGMAAYELDGRKLVYFGGWKHHVGLYPVPPGDDDFEDRIAPFRAAKGTLRFPLDQPVPALLVEDVVARLAERVRPS